MSGKDNDGVSKAPREGGYGAKMTEEVNLKLAQFPVVAKGPETHVVGESQQVDVAVYDVFTEHFGFCIFPNRYGN